MKKFILFCGTLFFVINCQFAAAVGFYCQNTNTAVNTGDPMENVLTACGSPTSTATRTDTVPSPITTQQWVYTSLGRVATPQGATAMGMVPQLIFTIQDDKVIEIKQSGNLLPRSFPCGVASGLGVNSTGEMVRMACGNPAYIQTIQQSSTITKQVTVWTYNRGPYQPQIIFEFENGNLARIISGQLGS